MDGVNPETPMRRTELSSSALHVVGNPWHFIHSVTSTLPRRKVWLNASYPRGACFSPVLYRHKPARNGPSASRLGIREERRRDEPPSIIYMESEIGYAGV